jgi:hypothetical protein
VANNTQQYNSLPRLELTPNCESIANDVEERLHGFQDMCSNNARETDIDFFKLRTRINYT